MSLDESAPEVPGLQAVREIAAPLAAEVDDQTAELDAIAWNLPRPEPDRLPPEEAWPADGAAA